MSVIAIKNTKDKIEIVSDSQTTTGYSKDYESSMPAKLTKIDDDLIIGSAGDARILQLFRLFCETNKVKKAEEMEILRFFTNFETWLKKETQNKDMTCHDNAFIIVIKDKAYTFRNFYMFEILENSYYAIGSGSDKAMVAMELIDDLEKAITAVCKVDLFCHTPLTKHEVVKNKVKD